MLPPNYKIFENILKKFFYSSVEYQKNPTEYLYRLDLTEDGQSGTFYFDAANKILAEKPQHYKHCGIVLKSQKDGKKVWWVNFINSYQGWEKDPTGLLRDERDVTYEFIEDENGAVGDGLLVQEIFI